MAVSLERCDANSPSEIQLALVIAGSKVTQDTEQRHAGFVVHTENKLYLYDLAWHNLFRKTEITDDYAFLVSDFIDPISATAVIGFLATLHHAHSQKIGYSINYEAGDYFDPSTGQLLKSARGQGLTCATFVLEVLRRYGFELIDKSTWPVTKENEHWQRKAILNLKSTRPASVDDFLAQLEFIGKVPRFKPEEALGAASMYEDDPLTYQAVLPASQEVVEELFKMGLK